VSTKTPYDFIISMEFETEELYRQYNNHPEHLQFIEQYWLKFIKEFQEADFTSFKVEELK
jgi:Stress responsive A/B Barrel Domain